MRVRKPTATLLICLFNPHPIRFVAARFALWPLEDLLPPYRDYF